MNKQRWVFVIFLILIIFGWYKFFYKTYNINAVTTDADCVVTIDVKRITNTLIWNFITTPSQWKISTSPSKKDTTLSWKDVIEIPDYVFVFHKKNEPNNAWYTRLKIKSIANFEKSLRQNNFEKINTNEYVNANLGLYIIQYNNEILVANAAVNNKQLATNTAVQLFTQKVFIDKALLQKAVQAKSHIAVLFTKNNFLKDHAVVTANLSKNAITIDGTILPNDEYKFDQQNLNYASNALCTINFTQPSLPIYNLIDATAKDKINKALNFNIDSVVLQSNKQYQLSIDDFINRADSAVTYTYDDEFNKIEKVVVNNVQEPTFNFTIKGDSVAKIYTYFNGNKLLEPTPNGSLFLPMPFAKSYTSLQTQSQLVIATNNKPLQTNVTFNGVCFFNLLVSKIPKNLINYLPNDIIKAQSNIEQINAAVTYQNSALQINCIIQKKKNDLPIFSF